MCHHPRLPLLFLALAVLPTDGDVNGNAYHVHFAEAGGFQPVDVDGSRIISLAYDGQVPPGTVAVETKSWSAIKSLYRSRKAQP
jgi:hypothetical protein